MTGSSGRLGPSSGAVLLALACAMAGCSTGKPGTTHVTTGSGAAPTNQTQPGTNAGEKQEHKYMDAVAAASLREQALNLLIDQATSGPADVRVNALEALTGSPRRLEPVVRAALVDKVPAVRITAAVVVGNARLDTSASFVEPLRADSMLAVRASAVYALRRCGKDVDLAPLAELLSDPAPRWRAHAAYLLSQLGDKSALPMLEEAVRDTFPRASASQIRLMELQIAEARVRLGDEEAVHSIHAALFPARAEDLEATALAAQITGEINDRAPARELVVLTRMKDDTGTPMPPEVRLAAAGSLAKLHIGQVSPETVALEYLGDKSAPLRAQAAFVLGQCDKLELLDSLEPLLADKSPQVRVAAANAIVHLTDQGGVRAEAQR